MGNFFNAKRIAKIGVFTALAFVLYLVRIPLAFIFPSFLELHVSDIPVLIGGFALGPVSGIIILALKILLKVLISATHTFGVGELSDFLCGLSFLLPSSLIYKANKTRTCAIIALVVGAVSSLAVSVVSNIFIIIPFYLNVNHWQLETIVRACSVIPNINADNFYLNYTLFAVIPFNLLRVLIVGIIVFLLYKPLKNLINLMDNKKVEKYRFSKSVEETLKIAEDYARSLKKNDVVVLDGDMGAGKTVFCKGVAKGLGIEDEITSPTYAYMNDYDGKLFHYDCYRLSCGEQALSLGLTDYFDAGGVCLIEWAENIASVLPKNVKRVKIEIIGEDERKITL